MCGIFGIILSPGASISHSKVTSTLEKLYKLSESRGKESAGLHAFFPEKEQGWTIKVAQRASELLNSKEYKSLVKGPLKSVFADARSDSSVALLAHSRLVTNGVAELSENNQPVRSGGVTMIHNGIVVNVNELWSKNPQISRKAEVDTEVIAALIADEIQHGAGPAEATAKSFSKIHGAASVAWTHEKGNWTVLATNTGDLYYFNDIANGYTVFASEYYIMEQVLGELGVDTEDAIQWLSPSQGLLVNVETGEHHGFDLVSHNVEKLPTLAQITERNIAQHDLAPGAITEFIPVVNNEDESLLIYNEDRIKSLRRCTRCVLPETFPFINFDEQGVCNYCHGYMPRYKNLEPVKAKQQFIDSLQHYHRSDGRPDALVAFSGGRDSSYGLHLIKKEFGLTPITFTYDWGMVTDLARRNIARICGELGVQNILVSADIKKKRENIRKNVSAWLKKPDLGLVPLFMAGDKHFFSVVNKLKRQTGIRLDLWCANPLENTDFKSGFCGVEPDFGKKRLDHLSLSRKAKMISYYAKHFVGNPGYLNASIPDTLGAFFAYYIEPRRDFFFMFDHFIWNEDEVNETLLGEYDWEMAPDTPSTWRIGDGTAPFYNYIYMTACGFSEFDTFHSNQIREGMITREKAMELLVIENRPRAETLRWYLNTIGLDFNDTIRRVNELDTMGLHR